MENIWEYLQLIPLIISLCAAIAAITPNTWDNKAMVYIRKLVDAGALNFWYAKNQK